MSGFDEQEQEKKDAVEYGKCPRCGEKAYGTHRDPEARKIFYHTGLCQKCQDETAKKEEEELTYDGSKFDPVIRSLIDAEMELHNALSSVKSAKSLFREKCEHEIVRDGDGGSSTARCQRCGQDLGWWCPSSPTHQCEYPEDPNDECCKFCGQPDERK
jgi:hypothetical protein